jgi:hypothetical protein
MFNEISHNACRLQIFTNPKCKPILPYFDLLYNSPNTCWYKDAKTGKYRQFLQHKGLAQGCPMSGGFAAIVLVSMLLKNINDTNTPAPHTSSFIDDTKNLFIPVEDAKRFIAGFEELGKPLGTKLNKQ